MCHSLSVCPYVRAYSEQTLPGEPLTYNAWFCYLKKTELLNELLEMSCFEIPRRAVMMAGDPLKCCPVASVQAAFSVGSDSLFQVSVATRVGWEGGLSEVMIVIF